jgi:hypothetical protein
MVTLIPFMFAFFGLISIERSGLYSIVVDLILIFLSGLVFGGEKRLLKGIRMTALGGLIFLLGFLLNRTM